MKQETYIKRFERKNDALDFMVMKNRTTKAKGWLYVVCDGPENDYACVDLSTAIELEAPYEWSAK